ncbi:MAG: prepilin peptidase [Verrucomicrobia bacterium]|nr:prepilin peptidase [Verrucomicrobiota bacterium]
MSFSSALLTVMSLVCGAFIGSFLGCLVYRLPRGVSLVRPARSFCPGCQRTIPWYRNVPVFGWLFLRGRCPDCGAKISLRYPLIEGAAAMLFWLATVTFPPMQAVVFWLFFALLLAAAFIDVEHLIIPDRLTFPGTALGIVCSALVPALHGAGTWTAGVKAALFGAAAGYGTLYAISYFGKLAFGRFYVVSSEPIEFRFQTSVEGGREFVFAEEVYPWDELFFRKKDRIRIETLTLTINQSLTGAREAVLRRDSLTVDGRTIPLSEVTEFAGSTRKAQFPREAMGLGDVKLMAVIGAFLGWPGVVFSIAAASVLGTAIGASLLWLRRSRNTQIPFGPYLALGAIIWSLVGPQIAGWYLALVAGGG